ncbi:uncharacterized protein LOC142233813 [Haematobia irritans]|uniref:uncharacterized protein LOC142233813 n=1 Tax=Haematobia irritans TaxID=7368 RepID=UPI003F4FC950
MNHNRIYWNGVIFVSTMLILVIFVPAPSETTAVLTEINELDCVHIQCPLTCPIDSYLKSSADEEEEIDDDDDDGEEELEETNYVEELGHFDQLPPPVPGDHHGASLHYLHKRDIPSHTEVERCCERQHCVCKECQDVPNCDGDQVAIEIHKGEGVPGNCCSLYKCVAKQQCTMGVKQSYWKSKCLKCSCFGESEMCEDHCPPVESLQNCFSDYHQQMMPNGESWMEGSCVSCICDEGEPSCRTPICKSCKHAINVEGECCPRCADEDEEQFIPDLEEDVTEKIEEEEEEDIVNEPRTISEENTTKGPMRTSTTKTDNELEETSTLVTSSGRVIATMNAERSTTTMDYNSTIAENSSTVSSMKVNSSMEETSTATTLDSLQHDLTSTTPAAEVNDSSSSSEMRPSTLSTTTMNSTETTSTSESLETYTTVANTSSSTVIDEDTASTAQEYESTNSTSNVDVSNTNPTSTMETQSPSTMKSISSSTTPVTDFDRSTGSDNETSSSNVYMSEIPEVKETSPTPNPSIVPQESISERPEKLQTNDDATTLDHDINHSETTSITWMNSSLLSTTTDSLTTFTTSSQKISSASPTNTPFYTLKSSTQEPSTTSSPFSENYSQSSTYRSSSYTPEELSKSRSIIATSAPEPLEPLHQHESYPFEEADFSNQSTQHQMRSIFDEIDYVIMIVLFIGGLLCIALGLIIRHTKNRKKMYSSLPNSETSLSQNSTHTMMTV